MKPFTPEQEKKHKKAYDDWLKLRKDLLASPSYFDYKRVKFGDVYKTFTLTAHSKLELYIRAQVSQQYYRTRRQRRCMACGRFLSLTYPHPICSKHDVL